MADDRGARTTALVLAMSLVAVACGGQKTTGQAGRTASTPTPAEKTPLATSPLKGTWHTATLSMKQLLASIEKDGFSTALAREVKAAFEAKKTVVMGIRIGGGAWVQTEIADGGQEGVGWAGTYALEGDHRVVATETSSGCQITYRYTITSDQLPFKVISVPCPPLPGTDPRLDLATQRALYETAPFTRDA